MTVYNMHCNLIISPDDVWLTILAHFCAYVNRNTESLRGGMWWNVVECVGMCWNVVECVGMWWNVEHEGKEGLIVYFYGTLEIVGKDYGAMVRDLLGKIRENIKSPELVD